MASRIKRLVPVTVNDVLDGHVALDLECLDRLYLHGYLGQLQVGGQVTQFLNHRGYPVPSPACLQQIGDAFRRRVASFAEANHIPVVPLKAADRNIEVMRPYLDRAAEAGRSQVAAIGVAQEMQRVFIARKRDTDPARCPQFSFDKKDRRVTVFYFYLWDAGFGPAFIKVCTYCPWPVKIWVNGHEWAKQQCRKPGSASPNCPTGSPPAKIPLCSRGSATCCSPAPSKCSSSAGFRGSRCRSARPTSRAGTGGSVDGPGRGVPHHRVQPAPPCPRVLRCPGDRQSRPGPARYHRDHLRPADPHGGSAPPGARSRPRSSPGAWTSPSTPSTSTPGSSSTSKTAAPCGSRPSSTRPVTWAASGACITSMSFRPGHVRSTPACCKLNVPARPASLRIQSSSGSRTRPWMRTGGELQPCALATLGSRPWPAPCASPCAPSPASPTGACAP